MNGVLQFFDKRRIFTCHRHLQELCVKRAMTESVGWFSSDMTQVATLTGFTPLHLRCLPCWTCTHLSLSFWPPLKVASCRWRKRSAILKALYHLVGTSVTSRCASTPSSCCFSLKTWKYTAHSTSHMNNIIGGLFQPQQGFRLCHGLNQRTHRLNYFIRMDMNELFTKFCYFRSTSCPLVILQMMMMMISTQAPSVTGVPCLSE